MRVFIGQHAWSLGKCSGAFISLGNKNVTCSFGDIETQRWDSNIISHSSCFLGYLMFNSLPTWLRDTQSQKGSIHASLLLYGYVGPAISSNERSGWVHMISFFCFLWGQNWGAGVPALLWGCIEPVKICFRTHLSYWSASVPPGYRSSFHVELTSRCFS